MKRNLSAIFTSKRILSCYAVLVAFALLMLPNTGSAASVTLTNNNSGAKVDLDSSAGMFAWEVDGVNHLAKQWFYYRIGNVLQTPINTISAASYTTVGNNILSSSYSDGTIQLTVSYVLLGGTAGSGQASILESISITNLTAGALNFTLYQYSDFNILGSPGNDEVEIATGLNFTRQKEGISDIGEVIDDPPANFGEADLVPNVLNRLDTVPGLVLNGNLTAGPGDVAWALQWDVLLAGHSGFDIFKGKELSIETIPEPSVLAMIALGVVAWALPKRRRTA